MNLYDKFMDKEPIKIVGVWKDEFWGNYHLKPALEGIGELHYIPVPPSSNGYVKDIAGFSSKIYDVVKEIKPDVVFCYVKNRWVSAIPFLRIKNLGIPTINISLEDTYNFSLVKDIAHSFTLNMTSAKSSLIKYHRNNAHAIYLPPGANLIEVEDCLKDIDICFIGKKNETNTPVIKNLQRNFNIEVYGKGWLNGSVNSQKTLKLYRRSKIVLGLNTSEAYSIKGRDFEILMSGSLYLCEYNPELTEWLKNGRELIFWKDLSDLRTKIKYYLKNEGHRQTIACMGYFKATTKHTWMDRFERLFKVLSSGF